MKRKIVLIFFVTLFFVVLFMQDTFAFTTPNYVNNDEYLKIVGNDTDKLKKNMESKGYKLLNFELCNYDGYTEEKIKKAAIKKVEEVGYKYNGGQDYYETAWYNGKNTKLDDPFPSYMFGKQTSRNMFLQWTIKDKMYILRIGCVYSGVTWGGSFNIALYSSDKINNELYKLRENELNAKKEEEFKTAYKNVPAKNESDYMKIVNYVLSDQNYNEAKGLKKLAKTDLETLKAWKNTIGTHRGEDAGTAKGLLNRLIEANKDEKKINQAISDYDESVSNVASKLYKARLSSILEGTDRGEVVFDDVLSNTENYKPDESAMDQASAGKIENATSKILTTISNVGIVVAVIMLAIIGIKYMIGSVEEKAQYKEDMLPYVIGAFILFGITGLVKILIAIGNQIN